MSLPSLSADDDGRVPVLDFRARIKAALKARHYEVDNEDQLQRINWALSQIYEDRAEKDGGNTEAFELLRRMSTTYHRFVRAMNDVNKDNTASRTLFETAHRIAGRNKQLFVLDRALNDPTIVALMVQSTPNQLKKFANRHSSGPAPILEAYPGIKALFVSVMETVRIGGSSTPKRATISQAKAREIVSELLALISIHVEPTSLARHLRWPPKPNAS